MQRLLLIDADGLVYHSSRDTLEESIQVLNEKIQNMFSKTEATHYSMFISQGKYFRHNLFSEYKGSRSKYPTPLKWIKTLKSYLIENWNAQWMDNVEADDLVAYWKSKSIEYTENIQCALMGISDPNPIKPFEDKVVCSPDKDLLQSIPGKHFNYSYKLENKEDPNSVTKGWWIETNKIKANLFKLSQVIIGDSTDSIKGCEGLGEAVWNKMVTDGVNSELGILSKYLNKYGQSQGIYEFQKNYRLLHLLDCDEDFMREVGRLPEFPKIIEIKQEVKPIDTNDLVF